MDPKVSVILLSYNQENYIEEAINSVLNQTYSNLELIVSDNGSPDDTQKVIKQFEGDERVMLLLHSSNEYVTKRYNQALNHAKGQFVSLLYGDDFYLPNKIEKQMKIFETLSSDWGVVHGPGFELNETTKDKYQSKVANVHGKALKGILDQCYSVGFINPISPLVRRECCEKYKCYEDLFTEGESIYMKFALSYKFYLLDEPLVVMREHDQNARWYSKRNIEIQDACLERLIDFKEFPADCLKSLRYLRVKNYRIGAWENIRLSSQFDKAWVRERLNKTFKLDPLQLLFPKNIVSLIFTFLPHFLRKIFNIFLDYLTGRKKQLYFDESFIKMKE